MHENNGIPIIDRLMSAEKSAKISRSELIAEIARLQRENDIAGMQSLFNAYRNWEVRERKQGVSVEVVEELAMRNFDVLARVADGIEETGSRFLAAIAAVNGDHTAGRITKFYRNAVGYEPPNVPGSP